MNLQPSTPSVRLRSVSVSPLCYHTAVIQKLGMVSAVVMPFFDIPLIARIVRRKSSEDISLVWTFGIWICILGMVPASWVSPDPILFAFAIVNVILFTAVVASVVWFHPAVRNKLRS